MVAAINRTLKDEMARDPRIVVFGEDVADCSREGGARHRARQGRRVQGDARPAARLRQRPRLQLAARRGEHRRPRRRHGDARAEAGRRDPVLRLHLAGDDADPRRDVDDAVPLEQRRSRARWSSASPIGGYLRGGAPYHSQSGESIFAHCPGIRIVVPVERRRTRPACCARRSAATIRCCSSSTSTSTARPTTRANIPGRTT